MVFYATIHAYIRVYEFVFDLLHNLPPYIDREITNEDTIGLYLLCRNSKWLEATLISDLRGMVSAAKEIEFGVRRYLVQSNVAYDTDDLKSLSHRFLRVWALTESLIEYDWYGLD